MRDRNHGAASGKLLERHLNLVLRLGIERRGRFIEQKNRRIFQKRARDREPLLLTAGKKTTFVADHRFIAVRLGHDEVMRISGSCCCVDFIRGRIEPPKLDVFQNGVVKQKCFLGHQADLFTERFLSERPQIAIVDLDCSRGRIIEA